MNISIDNRYCNWFIHIGRLIFLANHNDASVYYHIWDRACACYHSQGTGQPICDLSVWASFIRQLEALTVPPTHCFANNRIYFQSRLLAGTNSIAMDLMTMKDYFLSQHRPPAIPHFLLLAVVIAGDCVIAQWLEHSTCSGKYVA